MKAYNIYYDSMKVNKTPLNGTELQKVYNYKYIYKTNTINGKVEKIPTNKLRTVKCIII